MRGSLEGSLQVDNKGMLNNRQYFLFTLNVVYLFKLDNSTFLKALEGQWLDVLTFLSMLDQSNSTKSTSSEGR